MNKVAHEMAVKFAGEFLERYPIGQHLMIKRLQRGVEDAMDAARAEALRDAVKAIESKDLQNTSGKKLSDFQDGIAWGARIALEAVKRIKR